MLAHQVVTNPSGFDLSDIVVVTHEVEKWIPCPLFMTSPSPSESGDGFSLGSAKPTEQIHARQIVFSYQACTTCFCLHISMAPETVELSPVELSPVELTAVELTTWEGPQVIVTEGEAALEFWAIIGSSIAPECLGDSFHKTSAQIGATIYHQPQQGTSIGALRPGMEVWNLFSELYSEMTVASGNTSLSYILRLCAPGLASSHPLDGWNTVRWCC